MIGRGYEEIPTTRKTFQEMNLGLSTSSRK
jgi:hypothetical protein